MNVYKADKSIIKIDPTKSKGKGGEADIYAINSNQVVKLYKQPNHQDLIGLKEEQLAAKTRLEICQTKLTKFPKDLPNEVISPTELIYDKNEKVIGYLMKFIDDGELLFRYSEISFRNTGNSYNYQNIINLFKKIRNIVQLIHQKRVILGDFNDLNVIVKDLIPYFIDSDSFQFENFYCYSFTDRFIDPLICKDNELVLCKPHNENSDWYVFNIMLFQCLLFTHPYGGVYRSKVHHLPNTLKHRVLNRISVFDKDVIYPKNAIPFKYLNDDVLDYFYNIFEKDQRESFPIKLLENSNWIQCPNCQIEHCRNICPNCSTKVPGIVKEVVTIRGKVKCDTIFRTIGLIISATYQKNKLRYLYHENNQYKREEKNAILTGQLDPLMRYRIQEDNTIIGKNKQIIKLSNTLNNKIVVDSFGSLPMFDTNSDNLYILQNGELLREKNIGGFDKVGDVLKDQTLFWTGETFGFGFYRAGEIQIGFVFNANSKYINDSVELPRFNGQLIDSTCIFNNKDLCWFLLSLKQSQKIVNYCYVINNKGQIITSIQQDADDNDWLASIRGKSAFNNQLFSITDDGIIRLEIINNQIVKTREFPDTEPFVDLSNHIFVTSKGIYIISNKEVKLLTISN